MRLLSHALTHYRNIEHLQFCPACGVNVLCGENGQGKTNLLESIFLLTGARSFRGGKDPSLIRQGQPFSLLESQFYAEGRRQEIRLSVSDKGRMASLNKGTEGKASSLVGKLCCVVFSPEHLALIKGTPDMRRRFVDTALCQLSPVYLTHIKRYNRLLTQRNSLLRSARHIAAAFEMLDVYDSQLVEAAAIVTDGRRSFIADLLPLAQKKYAAVSGGQEQLSFSYKSTLFSASSSDFDEGLSLIRSAREDDLRNGFCGIGPHRDDLLISLDGQDAKIFASQGQQRCIVLSLKLAEAELMELRLSESPLLLLDDVFSELDASRQDFLIACLNGAQSIISSCAPELISSRTDAAIFTMRKGNLLQ